ncbi:hypothetical protein [Joostella sp. CR20]|uniref:hypothetical protein n=1 Tax=Joostella sp. CR20 TaxID=2804312 RepID=UPI00313C02E8
MKGKTKTYILLLVVLVIWGIIGYNIYSSIYGNVVNEQVNSMNSGMIFKKRNAKPISDFSLHEHTRDPFLGVFKKKLFVRPVSTKQPIIKDSVSEIYVDYAGMVKTGNAKERRIYFVKINGERHLIHIGEQKLGVKLIKGDENQITITVNGKRKIVKK